MKRRHFFQNAGALSAGLALGVSDGLLAAQPKADYNKNPFIIGVNGHKITYNIPDLSQKVKIMHVTDTHLWIDDERGAKYKEYSGRMAKAYNETKHFLTGNPTHPEEAFEATLEIAKQEKADAITLTGDLFSFPSEAAIEWASPTSIPVETMTGTMKE